MATYNYAEALNDYQEANDLLARVRDIDIDTLSMAVSDSIESLWSIGTQEDNWMYGMRYLPKGMGDVVDSYRKLLPAINMFKGEYSAQEFSNLYTDIMTYASSAAQDSYLADTKIESFRYPNNTKPITGKNKVLDGNYELENIHNRYVGVNPDYAPVAMWYGSSIGRYGIASPIDDVSRSAVDQNWFRKGFLSLPRVLTNFVDEWSSDESSGIFPYLSAIGDGEKMSLVDAIQKYIDTVAAKGLETPQGNQKMANYQDRSAEGGGGRVGGGNKSTLLTSVDGVATPQPNLRRTTLLGG
jgi:hypothetical protein